MLPTRIVVGTDGSDTACEAVHQAIALAKSLGASLHVVSAYRTMTTAVAMAAAAEPMAMSGMASAYEWREASPGAAREILDRCAGWARDSGVAVETHAWDGRPTEGIISIAAAVGADLVMVGDKGMSGPRRLLPGSVPNSVAHRSPCSVWIVDTTARVNAPR
jgi:nucleotide-binding universal stress UspA family protein